MDNVQESGRRYNAVGWGLLCIIWGITILFNSVPFGAGLLGTGLVLLGANGVRLRNGLPARGDNTVLGILALTWAGLELARPALQHSLQSVDWDWAIFALLLLELGLILLVRGLSRIREARIEGLH